MNAHRKLLLSVSITLVSAIQALGATNAPNILCIYTDDHTYRMVGCYPRSYEFAHTPNIDRLSEQGVRFDQAYIGAKCRPSRAMMLSGRQQFAVETDYDGNEIPDSIHWFPTIRSNGYYTGMIGKWHYYGDDDTQHGTSWDWSVIWRHAAPDAVGDNYYWNQYVSINGGTQEPLNGYSTDRYADYTEQFIQERADDTNSPPWFYWLAFGGVHAPYAPADRHIGTLADEPEPPIPVDIYGPRPGKTEYYQDSKWTEGSYGKPYHKNKSLEFWTKQQMEAVLAIDDAVGRIVQKLEDTGQLDNTIIVFTSDQGYVWGQHGLKGKIDPYETAIRSPFIVSNPTRFPTNKVCKAPINGPDLIRTFHAWADAEPQQFMPGRDITSLIENPESEPVLDEWSQVPTLMTYVGGRYEPATIATSLQNEDWGSLMHGSGVGYAPYYFMILIENYKYTRYAIPDQIEELYDLDADPEELDNLAIKPQYKSKVLEMRAACIQSIKDNGGSVFADLLPPPATETWWPPLDASDNAHVLYDSGVVQDDSQVLKTKNGWGSSDSRLAYLRFNLSGTNEIGNYPADSILSVSLDLWMTQTEGDAENDLQVYALVDGAQDSPSSLSETNWTGSTGANPLLDTNLPQGNNDPAGSLLTTAMLGSHTFVETGDNSELGLLQIPLSVSGFKTLLGNDTNGEITLIVRSTSAGLPADFASMSTTNSGYAVPTFTIDALPSAPEGLSANAGDGTVSLNWQGNTESDLDGYNVYRSTNSGSYGSAIASDVASSAYADNSVINGTTYYYAVTAVDTNGNESPLSTEVSATPEVNQAPTIEYIEPLDGQSVPVGTDLYVHVDITDVDGSIDNAKLYIDGQFVRQENQDPYEWAAEGQNDPLLQNMTSGTYVLKTVAEDNLGALATNSITITVGADTEPPAPPTNLTALPGDALVSLDWDDNTEPDLSSYSVYRSTNSGIYGVALATNVTSSGYADNTAMNGTTYYYVVTAVDLTSLESAQSTEVSATPQPDTTPPAAPTGLAATAGDASVSLDWDDNTEPDMGTYNVYRSTSSGTYSTVLATGLASSAYTDNTAENGTTYYYVVTAVDINALESSHSTEVSATPQEAVGVSDVIVFGSNNDGLGGFTQTAGSATVIWSTETDGLKYRNQDTGTQNASLLKEFALDRSDGKSYTIEGVVHLSDGYADDNNRVGIYLFGDSASVPNEDETGAIGVIFNTDDGSANGAPGSNDDDNLNLYIGIDQTNLAMEPRNETVTPYAQNLFGTEIKLMAEIAFTNNLIVITAALTEESGTETTIIGTNAITVAAADYTGDWFGFVTRARARYYAGPGGTPEGRSLPWVMDYKSFRVTDNSVPPLTGYDLWASGWSTNIGHATNDFDFDGLDNLYEYGVDGNPTNDLNWGTLPSFINADSGFLYIHPQRSDDSALIYTVEISTNLVDGSWTNEGYTVTGTNVTGGTLNLVTNEIDAVEDGNFIRLKIGL